MWYNKIAVKTNENRKKQMLKISDIQKAIDCKCDSPLWSQNNEIDPKTGKLTEYGIWSGRDYHRGVIFESLATLKATYESTLNPKANVLEYDARRLAESTRKILRNCQCNK